MDPGVSLQIKVPDLSQCQADSHNRKFQASLQGSSLQAHSSTGMVLMDPGAKTAHVSGCIFQSRSTQWTQAPGINLQTQALSQTLFPTQMMTEFINIRSALLEMLKEVLKMETKRY